MKLWIGVAAALWAASVLLHGEGNAFVDRLWAGMPFEAYQRAALAIWLAAAALLAGLVALAVARSRSPLAWALRALALAAALAAAHALLIVNHVEVVHFLQYAAFTLLLRAGGLRAAPAACAATAGGVLDECWQYYWIYADHPLRGGAIYLDGNDMVLDALGAALGALAAEIRRDRAAP